MAMIRGVWDVLKFFGFVIWLTWEVLILRKGFEDIIHWDPPDFPEDDEDFRRGQVP